MRNLGNEMWRLSTCDFAQPLFQKRYMALGHKKPWTYRPWLTKKAVTRHRVADPLPVIVPAFQAFDEIGQSDSVRDFAEKNLFRAKI